MEIIIFIAGLMGFIVCILYSAFSEKYSRQMQAIAWIFGWVAMTEICFAVTKNVFPESDVIAVLFAAVATLIVMAFFSFLFWGWFLAEKKVKAYLTKLSKCFK